MPARTQAVYPGGEEGWACSFCSFVNHPQVKRCEMCGKDQDGYPQIKGKRLEQAGGSNFWIIMLDVQLKKDTRVEHQSSLNHGVFFMTKEEADSEEACNKFLAQLMDTLAPDKEDEPSPAPSPEPRPAPAPAPATASFTHKVGFLNAGNDLPAEDNFMTVVQAKAWAAAHPECAGFTYDSSDPSPTGARQIFFKSVFEFCDGEGWSSYQVDHPGGQADTSLDVAAQLMKKHEQEQAQFQAARRNSVPAPAPAPAPASAAVTTTQFSHNVGFMNAGNDLHTAENMTVAQAKAWARRNPQCASFTYDSADPNPPGPQMIFFKSTGATFCAGEGWSSWFVTHPAGAAQDDGNDVAAQLMRKHEEEQRAYQAAQAKDDDSNDVAAQLMRKHEEEQRAYQAAQAKDDGGSDVAEQMRLRYEQEQEEFQKKYGEAQAV